ncbi:MAG: ATP-binding protein [Acetatifactor sp.]
MKKFTGRNAELNYLKQYYDKEDSRLLVVYGSKGVGKTRLLQEFCRGKKWSYYLARACADREQRWQWAGELREANRELGKYPEYEELFEAALLPRETEKQILVIDEFHHMIKADSDFFEKLVRFLENRLLSRPVMVVLCTSASGWVENSLIGKIGSLAASIDGFLKLRELSFEEISRLFPEYSLEDSICTYAVLGGVPGYWMNFSPAAGIRENLIQNILTKESRLYEEMALFMEQELREPAVYNTILTALARDCSKLNDIYRHTGFSRAKISVYLKNLMELDLVEKVYSFETAGWENAQKGIYRISSPYVKFYYRYLFTNQSLLQLISPEEFYDRKIADSFELFVDEAYRKICREKLGQEYKTVGEWLGKTGNLDIVAMDAEGKVCVAMCSYAAKMKLEDYEWLLFSMKKAKLSDADIRLYCEKGFADELVEKAGKENVPLLRLTETMK